jgi:hypothetical protein
LEKKEKGNHTNKSEKTTEEQKKKENTMSTNKVHHALLLLALLLLCAATLTTAQPEDDLPPVDESSEVIDEEPPHVPVLHDNEPEPGELPHIPMHELDAIDHTELVNFCKALKSKYLPYIKHKFEHGHEAHIMSDAATLGKWLDDARHKHLQKDHQHFSCAEAKDILEHSSAKKFIETYTRFATKASEDNLTNDQFILEMRGLRRELELSLLVNQESLDTVDDAIDDLVHLGNWYRPLKQSFDHVVAKTEHCEKDFMDFLKELHDISTDKMPDWEHLHMGVSSIVSQCEEDESIEL